MPGYCLQPLSRCAPIIPLLKIGGYTCGNILLNDIILPYRSVSNHHCLFMVSSDNLEITDFRSPTGTFKNGVKIEPDTQTVFVENDIIGIGCRKTANLRSRDLVYRLEKHELKKEESCEPECTDNVSSEFQAIIENNCQNLGEIDDITDIKIEVEEPTEDFQQVDNSTIDPAEKEESKTSGDEKKCNKRARKLTEDRDYDSKKAKKNEHKDEEDKKNVNENSKENNENLPNQKSTLEKSKSSESAELTAETPIVEKQSLELLENASTSSSEMEININEQSKNAHIQENRTNGNTPKIKDTKREQEKKKSNSNSKRREIQESQSNSVVEKQSSDVSTTVLTTEHQDKDKNTKCKDGSTSCVDKQLTNNEQCKSVQDNLKNGITLKNKDTEKKHEKKKSISNNERRSSKESKSTTTVESSNAILATERQSNDRKKRESTSSVDDQSHVNKRHKSAPENLKNEVTPENKDREGEQEKKSSIPNNKRRSSEESKSTTRKSNDSLNNQEDNKVTIDEKHPRKKSTSAESIVPVENLQMENSLKRSTTEDSGNHSEDSSSSNVQTFTSLDMEIDNPSENADSTVGTSNFLKCVPSISGESKKLTSEEKGIRFKQEVNNHDVSERATTPSTSSQIESSAKELLPSKVFNDKSKYTSEPLDFLLSILKWNPKWLNNKTYDWKSEDNPPFVEIGLIPQLTSYKKYGAYYNTMSTFISLELWTCILRDFNDWNSKPTLLASINKNSSSIPIQNETLTKFTVEILCDKEQINKSDYPKPEDLVILSDKHNRFDPVLAYVKSLNVANFLPSTAYNFSLKNTVKNPHSMITYTMIAKSLPSYPVHEEVQELKTVYNISSFLRMILATLDLKFQPLSSTIIDPNGNRNSFSLSETPNYNSYELLTNDTLDDIQKKAVVQITNAVIEDRPKICLIDGPPGTGKSKVIVNIVTEILYGEKRMEEKDQKRILICSSSDRIIDELSIKLIDTRDKIEAKGNKPFKIVRTGSLAAMHPKVSTDISVNALLVKSKNTPARDESLNESIEGEKNLLRAKIIKIKKLMDSQKNISQDERDTLQEKYDNFSSKLKVLDDRYPSASENHLSSEEAILNDAHVIVCTLSSCCTREMQMASKTRPFSVCIIDEATLCCEPDSLLPLKLGVKQLILVGNSNQIPLTISSKPAKNNNYHRSLFSRIYDLFELDDDNPIITLKTQYRTASEIICWPKQFFNQKKFNTIVPVPRNWQIHRYQVFDLDSIEDNNSFENSVEANFIVKLIYTIASSLTAQADKIHIGVITPYEDQRKLLSIMEDKSIKRMPHHISSKIEVTINTIDESRGQEFDMVIMSCVRNKSIEFLPDIQELCHVFTRTKYSLLICGNFNTLQKHETWNKLLQYAKDHHLYKYVDHNMPVHQIKKNRILMKPRKRPFIRNGVVIVPSLFQCSPIVQANRYQ